ncbi:MAG: hypothetical protein KGL39_45405, partial [Patescibacteria group bacterium]|nr:hypothetical protein [Patescibacteria group bacterium]
MSTTLHCTTVREWQQALKWPPDKADEAKLDELITARTHAAMTKGRELGVHESGLLWIREYDGLTARGTHLFSGHVPTLWDGYNFYNAAHKQGGWRWVAAWEYMPYRQVAIHPAHRLVLT